MGKTPKKIQSLTSGREVMTTKNGWVPASLREEGVQALASGWGTTPHYAIPMGFYQALRDKVQGLYLGEFDISQEQNKSKTIPVFNGKLMNSVVRTALLGHFELTTDMIPALAVAGAKSSKTQELAAVKAELAGLSPEILEQIRLTKPELFKTLTGKDPTVPLVEEEDDPEDEDETDPEDEEADAE